MKLIENAQTQVIKDMEHTNLVTFNNVPTEFVECDGEQFIARSFLCHDWEVTLDGEDVCINPSYSYSRGLRVIDFDHFHTTGDFGSDELWVFFNHRKVLVWNNTRQEIVGEVSKVLDPRDIGERLRDLEACGEL